MPFYINDAPVNDFLDIFEIHRWENPLLPFIFHVDKITAGSYTGENWHESLEILQITEGEGTLLCDSKSYEISSGDIVVINSNDVHKIATDTNIRYNCFIIGASFCLENGFDMTKLKYTTKIKDEKLALLLTNIADEYLRYKGSGQDEFSVTAVRSSLLLAILYLSRNYSEPSGGRGSGVSSAAIRAGLGYINSNFTKAITLEEISRSVGVSKYHFLREFKRYTDHTVVTYINILRCEYAKHLLESSKDSVGDIARRCGFENLSYFTKTFKKYTGYLPSHFSRDNEKDPAHIS